jgi:hypothetical protein
MRKASHTISDILTVAGYIGAKMDQTGPNWETWTADYQGPARTTQENLLFITGNCGWKELDEAALLLRSRGIRDPIVVLKNSAKRLGADTSRTRRVLETENVFGVKEFLYNVLQRALGNVDRYEGTKEEFGLQYFTEPHIHIPDQEEAGPSLHPLLRWLTGDTESEVSVAVILAPAAFGKTTLSEALFLSLLGRKNLVPILLQRDQWIELAARGASEMMDIWQSGVRRWYPQALIGPDKLETFLHTGVICPVFDGLDELCSLFPSEFTPTETVENLISFFDEARVILTSRTQFWAENIAPGTKKRVMEIELKAFTPEQRDRYLLKRFPDEVLKRDTATKILDRISGKAYTPEIEPVPITKTIRTIALRERAKFEAIPFVVMLTAESADNEHTDVVARYGSLLAAEDPIAGLLMAFCDRERVRHELRLDPAQQIRLFQLLAVEFGPIFGREELELALDFVGGNVRGEYVRIRDHALLRFSEGQFRFHYDFVEEYLVARQLRDWLLDNTAKVDIAVLYAILRRHDSLLDRCAQLIGAADWKTGAKLKWASLPDDSTARTSFINLMLGLVKRTSGATRKEDTEMLLAIIGNQGTRSFQELQFSGSISGLDLQGIEFIDCRFKNIEFSNCNFDQNTRFRRCSFDGKLGLTACDNFGAADFDDKCSLSLTARGVIQKEQGRKKFPITETQVAEAVREALESFKIGAAGFKTRKVESVESRLRHIVFAELVIKALETEGVVERIKVARRNEIFKLTGTAETRIFLHNGTQVGNIKKAIDRLFTKLSS